jgi:hypothetical protein
MKVVAEGDNTENERFVTSKNDERCKSQLNGDSRPYASGKPT